MGAFDDLIPAAPPTASAPPPSVGAFSDLIPTASMEAVRSTVGESLRRRKVYDFGEALVAGLENSVPMLAIKRPGTELAEEPTVAGRLAYSAGQMLGDTPVMVAGAFLGGTAGAPTGPGAIATAGAGAFGLPAGLRAVLMDSYDRGEFKDFADFWSRAQHMVWETTKGMLTGGLTMGAGALAKPLVATAAPLVRATVPTAAEIATMTTVGAALEGRVPSMQEFADGAILVGGLKGSIAVKSKLQAIYRETGAPPMEVVAATRGNPELAAELKGDLPPLEDGYVRLYRGEYADGKGMVGFTVGGSEFAGKEKGLFFSTLREAIEKEAEANKAGTVFVDVPKAELEKYRTNDYGPDDALPEYIVPDAIAAARKTYSDRELPTVYKEAAAAETARLAVPDPKLDPEAAKAFIEKPYAEVTQVKGEPVPPTEVNVSYLNTAEDVKAASVRLSELYENQIQEQRRGTVSNEQTALEAERLYEGLLGERRAAGQGVTPAELYARKQILVAALEDVTARQKEFQAKGTAVTIEDGAQLAAAIERAAMVQAEFRGASTEAGRALQILKSVKRDNERIDAIKEMMNKYGGDPQVLAEMIGRIDTPEGMAKFTRDAHKATTWEKVIEAWKAGLLSGPYTHAANLMGNFTFMAMRPVVDAVAVALGPITKGSERVSAIEPLARIAGNLQAVPDAARLAIQSFKEAGVVDLQKSEQFRKAIEGKKGELIRTPFKLLGAADVFFKTLNERGEAYTLAIRQAVSEGLNLNTREFRERVAELVQNPPEEMAAAVKAAGERFTFNEELGVGGKKLQALVKHYPILQFIAPFIRTPLNIATELGRLTPIAPALGSWVADFKAGGARQAKAMAELTIGTSLMSAVFSWALDGTITGQGDPDPGKKRIQLASGWQPYSVKIGDKYYSYQRVQPVGTLMGLAADMATVWEHTTDEEADKLPKILAVAFGNAVTNQTFLQGITNVVQAASEPTRFGPKLAQNYAGSIVPAVSGQAAQMNDPLQREVNSMLDAIKNRIPGVREDLLPKRDAFGEPVQNKEKLGFVFPIAISAKSDDPVRSEAHRLGISVGAPPKKMHLGRATGKIGDVKLTPEQTDKFEEVSGKLAHELMASVIESSQWAQLNDLEKRRAFQRAEAISHKAGAAAALPEDVRGPLIEQIAQKIAIESSKTAVAR